MLDLLRWYVPLLPVLAPFVLPAAVLAGAAAVLLLLAITTAAFAVLGALGRRRAAARGA